MHGLDAWQRAQLGDVIRAGLHRNAIPQRAEVASLSVTDASRGGRTMEIRLFALERFERRSIEAGRTR